MSCKLWFAFAAVLCASASAHGEAWLDGALATRPLEHVDVWPGASVPPGFSVQLGASWPFLGSGLAVRSLRLQRASGRGAWAAAFAQEQSDIHVESQATAALQLARGAWRAGAAAGWRELRFERYATWRTASARLGAGGQVGEALRLGATWSWRQEAQPMLSAAAAWEASGLDLFLQLEREPALPARWRTGVTWLANGACGLLCGYDVATAAITSGVIVGAGAWRLAWAGLAHPDLGWSHAWTLEYRR